MKSKKTKTVSKGMVAGKQLNSMGVKTWERKGEFVFEFRSEVIGELEQLGFVIEVLEVGGGELPLPVLADHMDKHAALEAYWGAMSEKARYKLQMAEDNWNNWYNKKYVWAFDDLKIEDGIPKPTAKEVEAKIYTMYKKIYKKKQKKLRKFEHIYRMLCNVCHASIITKGKMMQSLRNILQDNNVSGVVVQRSEQTQIKV